MSRFGQIGIALGALGIVLAIMGLFPGLTGVEDTPGIGIVQVFMLLVGYSLLLTGAIIYIKFTFYAGVPATLIQQIGMRLALTGVLFASLAGLSDILGFGSHVRSDTVDIFFGYLQATGILASFAVSSIGVLVYALAGYNIINPGDSVPESHITSEMRRVTVKYNGTASAPPEAQTSQNGTHPEPDNADANTEDADITPAAQPAVALSEPVQPPQAG